MRLNDKTYPAYSLLEKGDYGNIFLDNMFQQILPNVDKIGDFLASINFVYKQVNNKYYLTNTFKSAINVASPKIFENNKNIDEINSDCGIIFTDKGFTLYLAYPTDKQLKLLCYGFTRDCLTTFGYINNDNKYGGLACTLKDGKPYNDLEILSDYLNSILTSLYFINNCELETKVLSPNEKHRVNGTKFYNESKSHFTILDCNWFTKLIRDTPFSVTGHLRWQRCGENYSKKKLIWIDAFEKKGYTKKAKIERV